MVAPARAEGPESVVEREPRAVPESAERSPGVAGGAGAAGGADATGGAGAGGGVPGRPVIFPNQKATTHPEFAVSGGPFRLY